jgi:GH25 family lysozyme M1 (1,4-beta-N-acetylmuramidase)
LPFAAPTRLRRLSTRIIAATVSVACLFGGAAYADPSGIDVSRWQHDASLSWQKAKADGVTFAFIKATEGSFYTNDYFAGDWAATRRVGIYRGAYHFARPSVGSARRQARYFVQKAGTFGGHGVLPPVLDLEADGGLGVTALRRWTRVWLRTTQELTGRTPIIYTGPYFWRTELGNSTGFRRFPLWIAHYTTTGPDVPGGWTRWAFWQKSQSGHIDGISGAVDINRFNGTRTQLAALAQAADTGGEGTDPGTGTTPDDGAGTGDGTTPDGGAPTEPPTSEVPETPDTPPAPTKAATAVSLSLSADTVFSGSTVEFSGRLRTSTGQALGGKPVALYRRASGSTTWQRITAPTTGTDGSYAVSFAASGSAAFRAEYAGGRRYAASTSGRRDLIVRAKISTTPTLAVDHTARQGLSAKVYGHLRTRTGRPVVGKTMYVYERPEGATRWALVERSQTLSPSGWYQAYVRPSRTSTYKAVFRGGTAFARSVSNLTTVRVR